MIKLSRQKPHSTPLRKVRAGFIFHCLGRTLAFGVAATVCLMAIHSDARAEQRPNMVVVVLDDLGYSDLGSYGSEIQTPNIDAIADDGIKYANFHSTPTCSPTRAAILTGREPHRVGMGLVSRFDFGERFPAFRGRITDKAATLAQVLSQQDYGTYAIGKWHLLPPSHMKPSGPFTHWPSGKGFDRFYGFLAGSTDQFKPELVRDNHFIETPAGEGYVLTRDLIDESIKMLHNHVSYSPDRPFFMYLSTPGMHAPHQASPEYIEKYSGKFAKGWDRVAAERLARQKKLGLIPQATQLPDKDARVESWANLSQAQRKAYAKFQEVYAGFLDQTDHELGRFIQELKTTGQYENTILVLVSDNGASQEGDVNGSVNHSSHSSGQHETVEDILARIDEIGSQSSGPNYPLGWAMAGNTPFRYFKQDTYSGGINVPFIIKPATQDAPRGEVRHQYHYVSDIMPTLLEYADIKTPETFQGIEQLPVDGISMVYSIDEADADSRRQTQFYRMGHNRGIYHQGWSAVSRHIRGQDYDDDHWDLYHLDQDISQSRDLSAKYPQKLEQLKELWEEEGDELNASLMLDPRNPGLLLGAAMKIRKLFKSAPESSRHVIYPEASFTTEKTSPRIVDRSFVIDARLQSHSSRDSGVVYSYGNADSGLVLYVDRGVPVFEYNYFANVQSIGKRYRIVSSRPLAPGDSQLRLEFDKTAKLAGKARLFIDAQPVGSVDMPHTISARISHAGSGMGGPWAIPVTQDSAAAEPFQGVIERVTVTVKNN